MLTLADFERQLPVENKVLEVVPRPGTIRYKEYFLTTTGFKVFYEVLVLIQPGDDVVVLQVCGDSVADKPRDQILALTNKYTAKYADYSYFIMNDRLCMRMARYNDESTTYSDVRQRMATGLMLMLTQIHLEINNITDRVCN